MYRCKLLLILMHIIALSIQSEENFAPVTAKVLCKTTKGEFVIDVHKGWAPIGANHFLYLVETGFYTDISFFRCVEGFLTQFGISDKEEMRHLQEELIPDDVNLNLGIEKNYVSFAGGGENTRSTQLFIAFEYLDFLGNEPWETPFGEVVEGQSTLDNLYKGYGEMSVFGSGPDQERVISEGNSYLREFFPEIDYLQSCAIIEEMTDEDL